MVRIQKLVFRFKTFFLRAFPPLPLICALPLPLPPSPAQVETLQRTITSSPPGMALSSRAHAFSVEALMGRPSKRKSQDSREEMQPELREERCVQKEEEVPSTASGDCERPGEYTEAAWSPCALHPSASPALAGSDLLRLVHCPLARMSRFSPAGQVVDCGTPLAI